MTIPQLQNLLEIEKSTSSEDPKMVKRAMKLLRESTRLDETQMKEVLKSLGHWPIIQMKSMDLVDSDGKFCQDVSGEKEVKVRSKKARRRRGKKRHT